MDVVCRNCEFVGSVAVGYTYDYKKYKSGRRRGVDKKSGFLFAKKVGTRTKWRRLRIETETDKCVPSTAIPCPQCSMHKLRRVTKCIRIGTSKQRSS